MEQTTMKNASLAILIMTVAALPSATAFAQTEKVDLGKSEYQVVCSSCHGVDARGNGPFAQNLKVAPPDLTVLARKNGGVFPAERISSVIDGRTELAGHGSREMPIWGNRYAVNVTEEHRLDAEAFIRGRVLLLVDYLNRIQQK
jgi:mono/diheme cytochrome c family protein